MADLISEDQISGALPPAGVPTQPGGSPLQNTTVSANPVGLIHEDQVAGSLPQSAPPAAGLMHEDQVSAGVQPPSFGELYGQSEVFTPPLKALDAGMKWLGSRIPQDSAVGKVMGTLALPLRAETGVVMNLAEVMGAPGAKEWNQKYNPDHSIIPNAYLSDISDFYLDKGAQALGVDQMQGQMGSFARGVFATAKLGLGLAENIYGDPLNGLKVGQLTEAAETIQKQGGVIKNAAAVARGAEPILDSEALNTIGRERNLLTYQPPFLDTTLTVKGQAVQDALSKVRNSPFVGAATRILSTDTGVPEVNRAINLDAMQGYGTDAMLKKFYLAPEAEKGFSAAEKRLITDLAENSSNLRPNVDPKIINAAKGTLSATEEQVRAEMSKNLESLAKKHGVDLVPGRDQTLIDSALNAKRSDSRYVESMVRSGNLDSKNVADKVISNHMPHVLNPAYNDAAGAKILADLKGSSTSSSRDITRQRRMQGSVYDINREIEAKYGKSQFFIEDPHVSTAIREGQAMKLERNTNTLETVQKYGVRADSPEGKLAKEKGWMAIRHPDFDAKTVVLKNPEREVRMLPSGEIMDMKNPNPVAQVVKHSELLFPREMASKVGYFLNKKGMYNFTDSMGELGKYINKAIGAKQEMNQILRATAFTSEGVFGRNIINNAVKGFANGVTPSKFSDAMHLLGVEKPSFFGFKPLGDGMLWEGGELKKPPMNPQTKMPYSKLELQQGAMKFGINQTNIFHDGLEETLGNAKKVTLQNVMQNKGAGSLKYASQAANTLMQNLVQFGEKGENVVRTGFWLQKLEEGYTMEEAAIQTNRWLFDYRRNAPATDAMRFFMPFVQHPIKSLGSMPELVGKSPSLWNFTSNSLPHVLGNAFHDPVSQQEINQLLPESLRMKDVTIGPAIPGNTWLGHIITNPKQQGNLGSAAYFDLQGLMGFGVVNHFDYFSQAARSEKAISNYGLDPFSGALLNIIQGHDNFGKDLNGASDNLGYLLREGVMGNIAFPNTLKILKEKAGLVDPNGYDPTVILALRGNVGQFGGFTNLDKDFMIKMTSLQWAHTELQRKWIGVAKSALDDPFQYSQYAKSNKMIEPISNQQLFSELTQKKQEKLAEISGQQGTAQSAYSALTGQGTHEDFIARMKSIPSTMKQIRDAYLFGSQRYLQMSTGAKSPEEARSKAGVQLSY